MKILRLWQGIRTRLKLYNLLEILIFTTVLAVAVSFRLYHIEFGLPHSFHADEPEIAEPAIKYTYELRAILKDNNYYKLIPVSYVYGTFPVYIFTIATMFYSKTSGILHLDFGKTDLYVFLRSLNAVFSLSIVLTGSLLYYKLFKDKFGTYVTTLLLALNWKLIVHAHYLNADIIITILTTGAFLAFYYYYTKTSDTKFNVVTAIFLGLAIGTKITAAISIPAFIYIFLLKKDYKGLIGFFLTMFLVFLVSNPFSLIYFKDFIFRIYILQIKENGLVFDSVDSNIFKYVLALAFIATPIVLASSLYGKYQLFLKSGAQENSFHYFLISNIAIYLVFFSLSTRRVDRWLLPILPIMLVYASYGITQLRNHISNITFALFTIIIGGSYLTFPILLLYQYQENTPKSSVYLWMQQYVSPLETIYAVTEEGLDPLNKLQNSKVLQFEVYESKGAQFSYPPNPFLYNYVVLASRPMENFKKPQIKRAFPTYTQKWQTFEDNVLNPSNFELVKEYTLPKPNLIEVSDVYIYKRVRDNL